MWWLRACGREFRRWHRNGYWKLSCGECCLVGSLIFQTRPWLSALRPFSEKGSKRLALFLHSFSRSIFTRYKWMLGIITLQHGIITAWFWCRKRGNSSWHQRPCVFQLRLHLETLVVSSWSFCKEAMFSTLRFKTLKIPVQLKGRRITMLATSCSIKKAPFRW